MIQDISVRRLQRLKALVPRVLENPLIRLSDLFREASRMHSAAQRSEDLTFPRIPTRPPSTRNAGERDGAFGTEQEREQGREGKG